MAADSYGTKNEPQFAGTGKPASGADLTELGAYAAKVGNRKVDVSTVRTGLTGSDVWEGLEFYETDTDLLYLYQGGGWVLDDSTPYLFGNRPNLAVLTSSTAQPFINTSVQTRGGVTVSSAGTVTFTRPGIYEVLLTADWNTSNTSGQRNIGVDGTVTVLGKSAVQMPGNSLVGQSQLFTTHVQVNTNGDTMRPWLVHNTGAALYVSGALDVTWFASK